MDLAIDPGGTLTGGQGGSQPCGSRWPEAVEAAVSEHPEAVAARTLTHRESSRRVINRVGNVDPNVSA